MRVALIAVAVAAVVMASGGEATAHHSIAMFDISTPIWVKGTFVRLDRINPHSVMVLDERKADGKIQRWTVEGPSVQGFGRIGVTGDILTAGDVIEVCAFALRPEHLRPTSPVADTGSRFVHGHLLRMPNGQLRVWGSYGKIENCIRPGDPRELWVNFLNTDQYGHDRWCGSKAMPIQTTLVVSQAIIDDIDRRMTSPCR